MDEQIFVAMLTCESDELEIQSEAQACDEYQSRLIRTLRIIKDIPQKTSECHTLCTGNRFKIPEVPLPTFCNERNESVFSFVENYDKMIGPQNLSNMESFVLLESRLKGDPLDIVKPLRGIEGSYAIAIERLKQAFGSRVNQQYAAIVRVSELNMQQNAYKYYGEFTALKNLVSDLKITGETMLQYFVWEGLPDEYKQHFIYHFYNKTFSRSN